MRLACYLLPVPAVTEHFIYEGALQLTLQAAVSVAVILPEQGLLLRPGEGSGCL